MTDRDTLIELAERVEKAELGSRMLDAEIHVAINGFPTRPYSQAMGTRPKGSPEVDRMEWLSHWGVKRFSSSIDAAMTLKHRGDLWCVGSMEDGPFARIIPAIAGGRYGPEITVHAETVENALTAGFLRANAARAATQE